MLRTEWKRNMDKWANMDPFEGDGYPLGLVSVTSIQWKWRRISIHWPFYPRRRSTLLIAILVDNRRVPVMCYLLESAQFTWNYEEKCHFILYLTHVRHVSESPGPLRSSQNVNCHSHACCIIRRCRLARSRTFSEYFRLFRLPHRKMAKGTSLAILVIIPVTLSFIPSDLGKVDYQLITYRHCMILHYAIISSKRNFLWFALNHWLAYCIV